MDVDYPFSKLLKDAINIRVMVQKMHLCVQLLKVIINKQIGPHMCNFYQRSHQQFKDQIE